MSAAAAATPAKSHESTRRRPRRQLHHRIRAFALYLQEHRHEWWADQIWSATPAVAEMHRWAAYRVRLDADYHAAAGGIFNLSHFRYLVHHSKWAASARRAGPPTLPAPDAPIGEAAEAAAEDGPP